ncbi:MAG: hypothetical protein KGK30_02705 [Elusimicrobia bacterium]|nr:hypothetical protein [Elusimicrobiota bacterium]
MGQLESFDPKALFATDEKEREVCAFVLALALAFNDIKDCRLALGTLNPYLPKVGSLKISPAAGQGLGLQNHILRHFYAVLSELVLLINKNPKPQAEPAFQSAISSLHRKDREIWRELTNLASTAQRTNKLLKALAKIRNEVASHYYGLEGLMRGYDHFFETLAPREHQAYLSRGQTAAASRFYFADAAAQGHVSLELQELPLKELTELSQHITIALYQIVTRFLETRAGGFYRGEAA